MNRDGPRFQAEPRDRGDGLCGKVIDTCFPGVTPATVARTKTVEDAELVARALNRYVMQEQP